MEGNAYKTTGGGWWATSDIRLKTDISDIDDALEVITRLRPVRFRYTDEYTAKHPSVKDTYYYNFIAQEFQEVFPDSVQEDGKGYLQIDTYNVRLYLVRAIQELDELVKGLKAENETLKQRIEDLEAKSNIKQ